MLARFRSFPFHFNLPDPDGRMVSLSDYKGKVVIVDFWGTWCPPCRMQIPHLIDVYKKYHGSGLEIVGINYEQVHGNQARDLVRNFIAENGVSYPCVMGDLETHKMVRGLQAYPTTLFIDRSGKVRLMLEGYTPEEELEGIVKLLLQERA
jgi:thiol-disulfide isomerase/thioredoxin